ncbi:nitrate- and nitrite sensing domain-containing protein [Saccharopolyspora griseoalba]|uniref:histidine kinase n=1 Tax=Saccharopolyspora griseoalba TaxID=1431848 RepID=A0ABW2LIJ6_9PSEU
MSSGLEDPPANATRTSMWSHATSKITKWRNWKLPVKIAAVVLVPVIFAIVLGVLQIRGQITQAHQYEQMDSVVTAGSAVRGAVTKLQDERSMAAEYLADDPAVSQDELRNRFGVSEQALNEARRQLSATLETNAVRFAREETDRQFNQLAVLRAQIIGGQTDPGVVTNYYTKLIDAMLAMDRTLISEISSSQLVSTATTVHELAKVNEEVRLQQTLVLTGLSEGEFSEDNLTRLAASETRRTAAVQEFRAAAHPQQRNNYDQLYSIPELPARETTVQLAIAERDNASAELSSGLVSPAVWKQQSQAASKALEGLQSHLEKQLHDTAFTLQDNASNLAGLQSVILLSALLLFGAIVVVIARHLLSSLDVLRRSALDTANHQLPDAVADIRAGRTPDSSVKQVPVDTTDEIGEVARAFDDVHTQAVNLASEQAELRRSYSDSFVNVSRRSQSLLERQLRLFEQLERDEEDPDQLATLFQLDHLSTRMRRNNENLMVLSGADLARRFNKPAAPADLLRAAISEIEHYPRVNVQQLPEPKVVGYAAGDLVRLLAELLDNAANFSAPNTQVVVTGERGRDASLRIDITDEGIGMNETEIADANHRLSSAEDLKLSTSRRMGLYVVGRLARRHGVEVRLQQGPEGVGTKTSVTLGVDLLIDDVALPEPRTNGGVYRPAHDDDTLIRQFDWEAAEQDAASHSPSRNGFHLFRGPGEGGPPQTDSDDLFNTQEMSLQLPDPPVEVPDATGEMIDPSSSAWFQELPEADEQHAEGEPSWPQTTAQDAGGPESRGTSLPPQSEDRSAAQADAAGLASWTFANDQEWERAEEVAAAEPADYTNAGLPVRTPRANLIAGSANETAGNPTKPARDPDLARGRLASFQAGVRRGRHRMQSAAAGNDPIVAPEPQEPEPEEPAGGDAAEAGSEFTASGLPRRSPQAQLVAGLSNGSGSEAKPPRDADVMRGRLASFQRGVREGKHTLRGAQPFNDESR